MIKSIIKLTIFVFLILAVVACGSSSHNESASAENKSPGIHSEPPLAIKALQSIGITIGAYVITSNEPSIKHVLTLDPVTNGFTGDVSVPLNTSIDLTVVYTADDPVTGETLAVAYFIRKGVVATGIKTPVKYDGEEKNWTTTFDLTPGSANDLNLDGDAYSNFVEIGYGANCKDKNSIPLGPKTNATHKDQLLGNQDVSVPAPGNGDSVSSVHGDDDITLSASTPFGVKDIQIKNLPSYGYDILSTDLTSGKKVIIRLHSDRLVSGTSKGSITFVVAVTDEFGLVRETPLSFAVSNPNDTQAPYEIKLDLASNSVIVDQKDFTLELVDPSGVDNASVSVRLVKTTDNTNPIDPIIPLDTDNDPNHFTASVHLTTATRVPDGSYTIEIRAKDLSSNKNLYAKSIPVTVDNSQDVVFSAKIDVLVNGVAPTQLALEKNIPVYTVSETDTVTLDASNSKISNPNVAQIYSWSCGTNFPLSDRTTPQITLPTVDVLRGQTKTIECYLDYKNGTDFPRVFANFKVTFVNKPSTMTSVSITGSQKPSDTTFSWIGADTDNDVLTYNVALERIDTNTNAASTILSCPQLTQTTLKTGDDLSALSGCTINIDKTKGELSTPFQLAAYYSYRLTVGSQDQDMVAASTALTQTSSVILPTQLVAWYGFNENGLKDSSATGNNLTSPFVGDAAVDATTFTEGSKSLKLDGNGDGFKIASNAAYNLGSGDFTLSAWVKSTVNGQSQSIILKTGTNTAFELFKLSGNAFGFWTYNCQTTLQTSQAYTDTNWHLLTVTRVNGQSMQLYVDGELKSVSNCSDSLTTTGPITIGCNHTDWASQPNSSRCDVEAFKGNIDNVTILNQALTVDEIRKDCRHNDLTGTTCPDPKKPIILSPLPGDSLSPTMAFWSWRGERDGNGDVLDALLTYELKYDEDIDSNGTYDRTIIISNSNLKNIENNIEGYVNAIIEVGHKYLVKIVPVESGITLSAQVSTAPFSTNNSLIARYHMDESVNSIILNDSIGSYNGDLFGSPLSGFLPTEGLMSGTMDFDGDNDYVSLRSSTSLIPTTGFTYTAWVNPKTIARGSERSVITKGLFVAAPGITLTNPGTAPLEIYFYTGPGTVGYPHCDAQANDGGSINKWHFIAGVYFKSGSNPPETACRVDAQDSYVRGNVGLWSGNSEPVRLGWDGISNVTYKGQMDEVLIYNAPLSNQALCNNYLAYCLDATKTNPSLNVECDLNCLADN